MGGMIRMSLNSPEAVRPLDQGSGNLELVNLEGGAEGRPSSNRAGNGPSTSSPSREPTAVRQHTWDTSSPGG